MQQCYGADSRRLSCSATDASRHTATAEGLLHSVRLCASPASSYALQHLPLLLSRYPELLWGTGAI